MLVTIEYVAQVKRAAGTAREEIEVAKGCRLTDVLNQLANQHGEPLASLLVTAEGKPVSTLLLFLGAEQVRTEQNPELLPESELTISTPISGG